MTCSLLTHQYQSLRRDTCDLSRPLCAGSVRTTVAPVCRRGPSPASGWSRAGPPSSPRRRALSRGRPRSRRARARRVRRAGTGPTGRRARPRAARAGSAEPWPVWRRTARRRTAVRPTAGRPTAAPVCSQTVPGEVRNTERWRQADSWDGVGCLKPYVKFLGKTLRRGNAISVCYGDCRNCVVELCFCAIVGCFKLSISSAFFAFKHAFVRCLMSAHSTSTRLCLRCVINVCVACNECVCFPRLMSAPCSGFVYRLTACRVSAGLVPFGPPAAVADPAASLCLCSAV